MNSDLMKRLSMLAGLAIALLTGVWATLHACANPPGGGEDAGVDAGTPYVDAGTPYVDAGTPWADAGIPPFDAGTASDGGTLAAAKWVSGYYAAWFPDMLPHPRIDMTALTHLIVGRAVPHSNGTVTQGLDADDAQGMTRASDLCQRAHAAGRKCVLMLGGVGDGQAFNTATQADTRAAFAQAILTFMDRTGMDGVDLDWEEDINYPNWLSLVRSLREARPGMVITLPVFPVNTNFGLSAAARTFFGQVHPLVDQVNVMSYGIGMGGPWGGWVTWHTGALLGEAPNHPTSIASSLAAYVAAGVPKAKMGMGIGFCGLNYGPPQTGPYEAPTGAFQADDVEWRYSQLAAHYLSRGEYHWDDVAKQSWRRYPGGYTPGPNLSTAGYLTYEDARSIAEKGAWLRREGYGGTILWVLNYDTLPAAGTGPLTTAAKRAFLE